MIPLNHEKSGTVWSARDWRRVKLSALCLGVLMAMGIVGLMILAAGKDEDIAGIVAPALAITVVSGVVAVVAAVRQKRASQQP